MVKIKDIQFDECVLLDEWEDLPLAIQDNVRRKVASILGCGCIPPSMQPHKITETEYWIGYITVHRGSYRMLYSVLHGVLHIHHITDHKKMEGIVQQIIQEAYT